MNNSKKSIIAGIVVCAVSTSVSASPSSHIELEVISESDTSRNKVATQNQGLVMSFNKDDTVAYDGKQKKRHTQDGWLDWLLKGDKASEEQDSNFT